MHNTDREKKKSGGKWGLLNLEGKINQLKGFQDHKYGFLTLQMMFFNISSRMLKKIQNMIFSLIFNFF